MMRSILPVAVILVFANTSVAAIKSITELPDAPVVVTYDAGAGNVRLDAAEPLSSIGIDSATGVFKSAAELVGRPGGICPGLFTIPPPCYPFGLSHFVFGGAFSSLDFGAAAELGLSENFLLRDLTARGSFSAGGGFNFENDNLASPSPHPPSSANPAMPTKTVNSTRVTSYKYLLPINTRLDCLLLGLRATGTLHRTRTLQMVRLEVMGYLIREISLRR